MNNENKTVNAICNQINRRILSMSYEQETQVREELNSCVFTESGFDNSFVNVGTIADILDVNEDCINSILEDFPNTTEVNTTEVNTVSVNPDNNNLTINTFNDCKVELVQGGNNKQTVTLNTDNIDGEKIEHIVENLGLSEQLFRQLFFKQSDEAIQLLLNEKKSLNN